MQYQYPFNILETSFSLLPSLCLEELEGFGSFVLVRCRRHQDLPISSIINMPKLLGMSLEIAE